MHRKRKLENVDSDWKNPFVGNKYYNWFTYLIKKSTGILRLFWSLKLFCWVGFNSRWGCIYLMIALDWGSIRNLRGWGCIQEWGSIQADTVLRIVNSISNAIGFFYPRYEHQLFPPKKPFLVDILESLHLLINSSSRSIPNDSNVPVERYILTTSVLLIINIFLQKKPKWNY